MLETDGTVANHVSPAGDGLRWRLIAAIAAGAALVQACGARAQDVADEDGEFALGQAGARATGSTPIGQAGARSMPRPVTPPPSRPSQQPAAAAPREGEVCYSPSDLTNSEEFTALLPLLPEGAIDDNGCLTSDYSGWLGGGSCSYDPRPAVVRGDRCCHLLSGSIPGCGRPLVVDGSARTAPVRSSTAWSLGSVRTASTGAERPLSCTLAQRIGREWLADARLEHASVGSFASFALSLLAVGAPPELLAACQRAGLDEVEHARACFALASRFIGEDLGPGPLSLSGVHVATALDELAVRTWLDGCVDETIAALTAAAQLDVARDDAVRAALGRIAADEARHAELAWSFVAWALASGGPDVRRALVRAGEQLQAIGFDAKCPSEDKLGADSIALLHAHGRLSDEERHRIRANAWQDVIRPALDALLAVGGEFAGVAPRFT